MPPDFPPIPPWEEPPNWARLPIEECGEPLVPVPVGDPDGLRIHPLYFEQGIPGATEEILLRAGVAVNLQAAVRRLAAFDVALVVFDGYRPLRVQQSLSDMFAADLRREHPELSDDELTALLRQFVANPTADPACPPPHRTGGAVDVYLVSSSTGEPLPMGTEPDAAVAASATRAFEQAGGDEVVRGNRRLLFHAMQSAGFANYYNEWWHYDFGNQRWANIVGAPVAFYGIAPSEK
jgi:D-alanyl-D-alanine dipeptidase